MCMPRQNSHFFSYDFLQFCELSCLCVYFIVYSQYILRKEGIGMKDIKRIVVTMLVLVVILSSFAGCDLLNRTEETTQDEVVHTGETTEKEDMKDKTEEDTEENINDDTEETTEKEEQQTEEAKKFVVTIYTPNDNVDGFVVTEVELEELNETILLNELIKAKVVQDGIKINQFEKKTENDNVYLLVDFNESLGTTLNSCGSSGEYVIMGSIVNTFLKAYEADYFKFTIDGQIFESGHIIYDEPMGLY